MEIGSVGCLLGEHNPFSRADTTEHRHNQAQQLIFWVIVKPLLQDFLEDRTGNLLHHLVKPLGHHDRQGFLPSVGRFEGLLLGADRCRQRRVGGNDALSGRGADALLFLVVNVGRKVIKVIKVIPKVCVKVISASFLTSEKVREKNNQQKRINLPS